MDVLFHDYRNEKCVQSNTIKRFDYLGNQILYGSKGYSTFSIITY